MYSFKYHLLTICGVFLALAIGLLLGAAIGGSGLLNTTTTELVEALSQRFTNLDTQNTELSLENEQYSALSASFVDQWDDEQLTGQDVLIISGSDSSQLDIAQEIANNIIAAGGRAVQLQVNMESFGLNDEQVLASLQEVLPEVDGRDYADVICDALFSEWTSNIQEGSTFDGGRVSSSQISAEDIDAYPVTSTLVQAGVLTFVNSSSIPDSINSIVDVMVYASVSDEEDQSEDDAVTYLADPIGVQIAQLFSDMGYPALLTQTEDASSSLMEEASSRGLAGLSSCEGTMGRYSLISLLSSGEKEVYGPDRDSDFWFPALSE